MNTETITITPASMEKISSLTQGDENSFLRIFVKSGGCSGYSYGIKIDEKRYSGDKEFTEGSARVVIDDRSWELLKGITLEYTESLMGGGFNIINPNATSACGCGSSFRTDSRKIEEEGAGCS
jgi:iron-sulfur cluster assembly protein